MQFVTVNGYTHHYHLNVPNAAAPDAPVIAFANSLGTDFRIWNDVIARLPQDVRTLCYDMRGHGLTALSDGPVSISDLADDFISLLDVLGIASVHMVGLSVGGMVAQSVAARAPDRISNLVLCDTAHKIGTPDVWNPRIAAVQKDSLSSIAEAVLARWFDPAFKARSPEIYDGAWAMLTRTPSKGYTDICAAIRDADLTEATAQIEAQTLCLCGSADLATPPDLVNALADLIPNARYEVIKQAGHLPCLEQADVLAQKIIDFLKL
ncbi:MAG: 3-oxoadipate enol-lactonase [Alphaproteobacteria bacterium]|nr:3-oxoadipate enol-lactonase [Alphaproteobacteria bacterium]